MIAAAMSGNKADMPTFVDVPEKFFNPESSGITAKVDKPEGINEFDVVLK